LPEAVSIFILPPSLHSLWQRLETRGSDNFQIRWGRLQNAYNEIQKSNEYEHLIINDDLAVAFEKLKSLVTSGKSSIGDTQAGRLLCSQLNEEFKTAEWIRELRARLGSES
jgi:guanylate kinase